MARPRSELQVILDSIPGVTKAYFQPGPNQTLQYPCIVYTRDDSFVTHADNVGYYSKKRYMITVIDRNPDSLIPDLVESQQFCGFDRFYIKDGLNHSVFNMFF